MNFTTQCSENRHTDIVNFATLVFRLTKVYTCNNFCHARGCRRQRRWLFFRNNMAKSPTHICPQTLVDGKFTKQT